MPSRVSRQLFIQRFTILRNPPAYFPSLSRVIIARTSLASA